MLATEFSRDLSAGDVPMGAWSAGSFGNDTALDFVDEIQSESDLIAAFKAVKDAPANDIDAVLASEAIAAADVVAACLGRPAADMPEELTARLDAFDKPSDATIRLANEIVNQVSADSELAELWDETEDDEWNEEIDNLLARLDQSKPYVAPEADAEHTPQGSVGFVCHICETGIPDTDLVTMELEDDISVMSLYAHRTCVEEKYEAPHFNADGSPHVELLAKFKKFIQGLS